MSQNCRGEGAGEASGSSPDRDQQLQLKRTGGGFFASDALLIAYIALVSSLILIRLPEVPGALPQVALHIAVGASTVLLAWATRRHSSEAALMSRVVFVCVTVPILFLSLGGIVRFVNPFRGEIALKEIDDFLFFGRNPNVLLDHLQAPALTEYLQIIYSLYYFLPFVLMVGLVRDRNYIGLEKTLFAVSLCLLLSYIGYFIVPATAPYLNIHGLYPWPPYDEELRSGASSLPGIFLADPIRRILHEAETIRHDCFPSGHAAMSVVVLFLARRLHRGAFRILLVPVVSLVFSTMYLRYHYVSDVIAGLGLAAIVLAAAPRLESAFERRFVLARRPAGEKG